MTDMPPPPARIRQAASLIVLRDREGGGIEVLMLRRVERVGDQFTGAAVFPGGTLDAADAQCHALCDGLDDATASTRLKLPGGGLDYWVASVRECFEEAGLLFATDAQGAAVDLDALPADTVRTWRHGLHDGTLPLASLCAQQGWRLRTEAFVYFSHWLTPPGRPKRFDTRFFVVRAPANQTATGDEREAEELMWITPVDALDRSRKLELLPVTRRTLEQLGRFDTVQAVLDHAAAQRDIACIMPRLGRGAKGGRPVLPEEWAYAEIGRLDPEGRGDVSFELVPGRPVQLSERVLRVTADNGSVMTGPGTNSYFVGSPGGESWVLIDPGPADDAHIRALIQHAPGPVMQILVTHTHKDHSPAAAALHAATGAPRAGQVATHPEWQDTAFVPERVLADGDRIEVGPGCTLRVIHTPGHASNHLCYLLEQEQLLFTGDHLMQGSTVVINPPDGDMAAYLASLRRLLEVPLQWLAPGHGFLIDQPHEVIRKTITHRLAREAKVINAVRGHGPATLEQLLPVVYGDVNERLHAVAARSLRAHLLKLRDDGLATVDADGCWRMG
jgi:glyoxylase-like metal-dependent hydrolase (beta-lactamase superfamily II)/8-oxo-dGTP pyrophosphatase MutT (NUDIX family)